jgi:hypothetical protein
MNKKHVVIVILVIIVILIIVFIKQSDSIQSIKSEDGLLSMNIPESAMPNGVGLDDISIKMISSEDESFTNENGNSIVIARYDLQPNGTRFSSPIEISYTAIQRGEESALPLLIHEDDDLIEILTDVEIEYTNATGTVHMHTTIDSFSEVRVEDTPFFADSRGTGVYSIGSTFPVTIDIFRQKNYGSYDKRIRFNDRGTPYFGILTSDEWSVNEWTSEMVGDKEAITPSIINHPAREFKKTGEYIAITDWYTCNKLGDTELRFKDLVINVPFSSKGEIPKMSKYVERGPDSEGKYDYKFPLPLYQYSRERFGCFEGGMIQLKPEKPVLQSGTSPLGELEKLREAGNLAPVR